MKFKLEINMDNAAFADEAKEELQFILTGVQDDLNKLCLGQEGKWNTFVVGESVRLIDSNGNSVGEMEIVEED